MKVKSDYSVSVIIPAYNVEKYISKGIESVINQTYKNLEIIIVDDGSTDNTYNIVKKIANRDRRIKVFQKINGGVSSARNLGLRVANSKYVIFLDSDDWLEEDAIEYLMDLIIQYGDDNFVCCDRYWISYNKKSRGLKRTKPFMNTGIEKKSAEDALLSTGTGKYNLQSACYKLFDLDKIKKNDIYFNESIYYGEDGLFVFEYLKQSKGFIYSAIGLWNILERPGSATNAGYNSKILTAIDAIQIMLNYADNSMALEIKLKIYLIQRIEGIIDSILESNNFKDILKYQKRIREEKKIMLCKYSSIRDKVRYLCYAYLHHKILKYGILVISLIKKPIKTIYYKIMEFKDEK